MSCKQALALFDCSTCATQRMRHPDRTRLLSSLRPRFEPAPEEPLPTRPTTPPRKPPSHSKNAPASNTRAPILRMTGVALVAVPGISPSTAQTMLSEIGTDMSKWPDEQHGCAWRGLAPQNAIAGGKVLQEPHHENPSPCRPSPPHGGPGRPTRRLRLGGLFPAVAKGGWGPPRPLSPPPTRAPVRCITCAKSASPTMTSGLRRITSASVNAH